MAALDPRKLPRQGRSRATVDAILDACAEAVGEGGYAALTTNRLAQRAGVSVGTLYQYFPNREAVAAALASRAFQRLVVALRGRLEDCAASGAGAREATASLLQRALEVLVAERPVFRGLLAEAPELFRSDAVRAAQADLLDFAQEVRQAAADRLELHVSETDAWLIGHMVAASMLQISALEASPAEQTTLTRQVAQLIGRMALDRSQPLAPPRPRLQTARAAVA